MESVASCPIVNNKTDLDDVRKYDDERLDWKFVRRVVEFFARWRRWNRERMETVAVW